MRFKIEYFFAVVVLLIMGAMACAQAPPACVGDQCSAASVEQAKSAPQHSVVCKRTYATQFGAKHPVLSAPVRIVGKAAKGTKRVMVGAAKVVGKAAKVILPPYPRLRR